MGKLSPTQQLVLSALVTLESEQGANEFLVREVLDQIWHEQFNLNSRGGEEPEIRRELVLQAAQGEKDALRALKISHANDLRAVVRARATKRGHTTRPWARALEGINPSRCFLLLAKAGLIERSRSGRFHKIRLTDKGRVVAALGATGQNRPLA
jgi:hypothetical protein